MLQSQEMFDSMSSGKVVLLSSLYDNSGREGISVHANEVVNLINDTVKIQRILFLSHNEKNDSLVNEGRTFTNIVNCKNSMTTSVAILLVKYFFYIGELSFLRKKTNDVIVFIGYHWVILIPFLPAGSRCVYVPFDCWSAREKSLASNLNAYKNTLSKVIGLLRNTFGVIINFLERLAVKKCIGIFVVSDVEVDKFKNSLSGVSNNIHIDLLPTMALPCVKKTIPDNFEEKNKIQKIMIWMDCRIPYGRDSVRLAINSILESTDLGLFEIVLLSRLNDDLFMTTFEKKITNNIKNIEFVDSIEEFLDAVDIVVLPDISGSGVKNRLIQALNSQKIVVATKAAALGVLDSKDDFVMQVDSPQKIADGIVCVISNWHVWCEKKYHGLKFIEEYWGESRRVNFKNFLHNVVNI